MITDPWHGCQRDVSSAEKIEAKKIGARTFFAMQPSGYSVQLNPAPFTLAIAKVHYGNITFQSLNLVFGFGDVA